MRKAIRGGCAGALLTLGMVFPAVASADTFTVTNNSDTGAGSLRAAIDNAEANNNSPTLDTINFTLPLTGGDTISTTGLPQLDERVSINGCSSTLNNAGPCVGLRHATTGMASGFSVGADSSTIRGIAFTNFFAGVHTLPGASLTNIQNNHFGLLLDGSPESVGHGVFLEGDAGTVGGTGGASGTSPADRNVIANSFVSGIMVRGTMNTAGGDNNQILGNYVGTTAGGNSSLGVENLAGIRIEGSNNNSATNNVVGGTLNGAEEASPACDGPCNVISGADPGNGLLLQEGVDGTTVAGNYIGVGANGSTALGNTLNGISLQGAAVNVVDTEIGGIAPGSSGDENLISNNDGDGIQIAGAASQDNRIGRNRGSGNDGQFIDIGNAGPGNGTVANDGSEAPTITSATSDAISGTGAGPNAVVRVFRKTDATLGELGQFVGQTTANGSGAWSLVPSAPLPANGQLVTATQTTTAAALQESTSELATAVPFTDLTPPPAGPPSDQGGGGGPPSNQFTIGELAGTKLTVTVPGPGTVGVKDAAAARAGGANAAAKKLLLKPSNATATAAGPVTVTLKLAKPAKQKLKQKGKVAVNAAITFTPTGGTANTQTAKLKIKK